MRSALERRITERRARRPDARARPVQRRRRERRLVALVRRPPPRTHPRSLTPRQAEIVSMRADGMMPIKIAARLGLRARSVSRALEHCRQKVGAKNMAALIAEFREHEDWHGLWLLAPSNGVADDSCPLSPRQVSVVRQLAAGASQRQIAQRAGTSPEAVRTHLTTACRKLGTPRSSTALVAECARRGWLGERESRVTPAQRHYLDAFERRLAERDETGHAVIPPRMLAALTGGQGDIAHLRAIAPDMLASTGRRDMRLAMIAVSTEARWQGRTVACALRDRKPPTGQA